MKNKQTKKHINNQTHVYKTMTIHRQWQYTDNDNTQTMVFSKYKTLAVKCTHCHLGNDNWSSNQINDNIINEPFTGLRRFSLFSCFFLLLHASVTMETCLFTPIDDNHRIASTINQNWFIFFDRAGCSKHIISTFRETFP